MNNFNLSFLENQRFGSKYEIDSEVKKASENTIDRFKQLGLSVKEFSLNKTEFENLFIKMNSMFDSYVGCLISSKKKSMDDYFSDKMRFGSDSPVKNFDDLFNSELLNLDWKDDFNVSIIFANDKTNCNLYHMKVKEMKNLVLKWYEIYDLDCIIVPTSTNLPEIREKNQNTEFLTSITFFGIIVGFPIVNLPVSYSKKSLNAPDGLPIGMSLIGRPERLNRIFKIAQAYEKFFQVAKLPSTTPLFNDNTNFFPNSYFIILNLFIFIHLIR